ncbi:hypothetical protein APHAL10511_001993 [Amanita phalloides]|nr:hypothetical protein APHAL10511_001993 [Amanita phalloides]
MSPSRRLSADRSSLLDEAPPSYHSIDDVDERSGQADGVAPINRFSKTDLCWILAGLWSGVLLGAFDGTVVATLLAPIGSEFQASHQSSYIGTAYLLSVCCFTPLYGRLADILGRKGAMLLALSLFGSGTIFCGFAPSMKTLIVARTVAGMGGGGVMTVASIAVTDLIPLNQRGLYQGIANILYGLGAGLGGPLGGWVNDTFGWRAAFQMQIPLLVFSIALVAIKVNIVLPHEVQNRSLTDKLRRIDFLGSLALVTAVGTFLLAFSLKASEEMHWSDPLICGLFITSIISTVLFVVVEKHFAPYPVMPVHLITQRTPLSVSVANFFASITAYSMASAPGIHSSNMLDPFRDRFTMCLFISPLSDSRMLPNPALIYYPIQSQSLLEVFVLDDGKIIRIDTGIVSNERRSQPSCCFLERKNALGVASLITTTLIAMIAAVYKEDMAVATGITYLFRTTGQVLGVSLSGALLQAVLVEKLQQRIKGADAAEIIYMIRHNVEVIPNLSPSLRHAAVNSYADALRVVFIGQAAINVLSFIACIPIQENPLSAQPTQERDPEE